MVERTATLNNNHIINHTADKPVIEFLYFGGKSFFEKRITCTSPPKTHPSIQTKTMYILYTWMFPKIGVPPNHPILIGFSDHFGVPLVWETPTYNSIFQKLPKQTVFINNQTIKPPNSIHIFPSIKSALYWPATIYQSRSQTSSPLDLSSIATTFSGFLRAS